MGCFVRGCVNTRRLIKEQAIPAFCLPKDPEWHDTWVRLIGRPDLKKVGYSSYHRVCCIHFEPSMFIDKNVPKKGLIRKAFPTLYLPTYSSDAQMTTPEHSPQSTSASDTDEELQESEILALEQEIANIFQSGTYGVGRKRICTIPKQSLTTFQKRFIEWQKKLVEKYTKHEYNKKFNLFCLNFYCSAPKAYKLFQKSLFLPSPNSLKNMKIILPIGNKDSFFKLLKKQLVKMPYKAKYVTICIDEIALSRKLFYDIRNDEIIGYHNINGRTSIELADKALVLRMKGCFIDYEQIIGYGLNGSSYDYPSVRKWLNATIMSLFQNSFIVCAVIASPNCNMRNLALICDVNPKEPFINIEGKNIFFLFDIPQLMCSIRDSLLECDFVYQYDKMASWEFIETFYEKDMERKVRLAPKLTYCHIKPGRHRSQLHLMKEVFSYTVAAGIAADVEAGLMPPEASGTAEFLMKMNNLYDLLNLDNFPNKDKDNQIQNLLDAISMLESLKVMDKSTGLNCINEKKCFDSMLISVRAVLQLQNFIITVGIESLPTRRLRLNSDVFFSDLHHQQGKIRKTKPLTPIQFRRCFTKLALKNILKNSHLCWRSTKKYGKTYSRTIYEENTNDFNLLEEYFTNAPKSSPLAIGTTDYRLHMPTIGAFEQVCAYLLQKCLNIHNCDMLQMYIENCKMVNSGPAQKSFVIKRLLKEQKYVLPTNDFIDSVRDCEKWFCKYFSKFSTENNIGAKLLSNIHWEIPDELCPCFPAVFLKKLFLRLRIYHTLKFRNMSSKPHKRKKKSQKERRSGQSSSKKKK